MKTIKFFNKLTATAFLLGTCAVFGSAQTTKTDSTSLTMNATVVNSIQLNLSNAGVTNTGDAENFVVSLGDVSGLGLGTPDTGVTATPVSGGYNYSTTIRVTPVYSGFESNKARIEVDASGADADIAFDGTSVSEVARRGLSDQVVSTGADSGEPFNRVVGLYISQTEKAGGKTAILTYTATIDVVQ